jgi:hypothetical protein
MYRYNMIEKTRSLLTLFWWMYMPGVKVKLRWPKGTVVVGPNDSRWYDVGATWVEIESADPNDFYRPWLEQHVGRQGWDWDWRMEDNDVGDNLLTVKLRRSKASAATALALKWS